MPGNMLDAVCPCGLHETVWPGCSRSLESYVIAYDHGKRKLTTLSRKVAIEMNYTIYRDPYSYNPFELLEDEKFEIPDGSKELFVCPRCGEKTMRFFEIGNWD